MLFSPNYIILGIGSKKFLIQCFVVLSCFKDHDFEDNQTFV